jgi:hypothetical protein
MRNLNANPFEQEHSQNFVKVKGSKITEQGGKKKKKENAFAQMNNIIAHLLSNLTW